MSTWAAPSTDIPVHATVTVPGSKSQTNRALVLAALAADHGPSTVSGALRSRDTDLMIGALRVLGFVVDASDTDTTELTVSGTLAPPGTSIDCGLAGTVLRFLPPVAALSTETVTFDGDEQARARPIAPLLDALRGLGVQVEGDGLPFAVHGDGAVRGGTVEIDASASSQFVSGLLLAGAAFTEGLTIVHTGEPMPSAPHVAMTVSMLRDAGVDVVFDPVGLVPESCRCVGWGGRVLVVGFAAGIVPRMAASVWGRLQRRNLSLVGVHWAAFARHDPAGRARVLRELGALLAAGRLKPVVFADKTYDGLGAAGAAMDDLAHRRTWGKVVVHPCAAAPAPGAQPDDEGAETPPKARL